MAKVTIKKAAKLELMTESGHKKRAEVSIEGKARWRGAFLFGCFVYQLRNALIRG